MLDRFLINLNRGEGREEKLARWRRRRESLTMTVFLIIFLIMTAFNYNNYKSLQTLINAKEEKIRANVYVEPSQSLLDMLDRVTKGVKSGTDDAEGSGKDEVSASK